MSVKEMNRAFKEKRNTLKRENITRIKNENEETQEMIIIGVKHHLTIRELKNRYQRTKIIRIKLVHRALHAR